MDKHVIMLNTRLVILICLSTTFTNVSSCDAESITIKDPVSGSIQCQDCRKCPAGEGLSVRCGDEISSSTPIICKPCVLGETYSSAYEAGACKDCENCGPYRETTKACTLTSKAKCGKCKVGAYVEPMLSMCKPCSKCCNDGKDIVISQCQVPGVPANKQCSFARSGMCSKVVTNASVCKVSPTMETNHSTVQSTIPSTVTNTVLALMPSEPITALPLDASPPQINVIVGSVLGVVLVVFILPLAFVIYCVIVKRWKARERINYLSLAEITPGEKLERRPQCLSRKVVTKVKTKLELRKASPQVAMVTQASSFPVPFQSTLNQLLNSMVRPRNPKETRLYESL